MSRPAAQSSTSSPMRLPSPVKQEYFIFGHNISHSLSPALHNAGFRALGLPHHYSIHQSENVDGSVETIINRPNFGGASITFPHKLQIGKLLASTTPCAEKVGAVNTITVQDHGDGKRSLHGDNTDWVGIKRCIERNKLNELNKASALVLGAGGAAHAACYALKELGVLELLIVNRTKSNGEAMASHFPELASRVYNTFNEALAASRAPLRIIVACVPADDLGEDKVPKELFTESETGVLVEMAYKPQTTGMMSVAKRFPGWKVCRGVDVLEEQAYEQFRMWTGREAPRAVMKEAMYETIKANM